MVADSVDTADRGTPGYVAHRGLDGLGVELSGPFDLTLPFTSVADVDIGGRRIELTSGGRRLGDDLAEALGAPGFDTEFTVGGGTLRVASWRRYDPQSSMVEYPVLAAWQGMRHSLTVQLYRMTPAEVLTTLRPIRIEEVDDGLVLRPEGSARFARPATVVKEVPGIGLLEISTTAGSERTPRRTGPPIAMPDGELVQDTLSNQRPYFILTGPRVRTTVLPGRGVRSDAIPDMLRSLRIDSLNHLGAAWTS